MEDYYYLECGIKRIPEKQILEVCVCVLCVCDEKGGKKRWVGKKKETTTMMIFVFCLIIFKKENTN